MSNLLLFLTLAASAFCLLHSVTSNRHRTAYIIGFSVLFPCIAFQWRQVAAKDKPPTVTSVVATSVETAIPSPTASPSEQPLNVRDHSSAVTDNEEPPTASANLQPQYEQKFAQVESLVRLLSKKEQAALAEAQRLKTSYAEHCCRYIIGRWMRAQRRGEPPMEQFWSSDSPQKPQLFDVADWTINRVVAEPGAELAYVEMLVVWKDRQTNEFTVTVDLRDDRDLRIWAMEIR